MSSFLRYPTGLSDGRPAIRRSPDTLRGRTRRGACTRAALPVASRGSQRWYRGLQHHLCFRATCIPGRAGAWAALLPRICFAAIADRTIDRRRGGQACLDRPAPSGAGGKASGPFPFPP